MDRDEYTKKAAELDRLLNDSDVPMEPSMIWLLAGELATADASGGDKQVGIAIDRRR